MVSQIRAPQVVINLRLLERYWWCGLRANVYPSQDRVQVQELQVTVGLALDTCYAARSPSSHMEP